MTYPTLTPSSRSYSHGDWPVKTYSAMNGAEVRILYGDRRTNPTFNLNYQNIPDSQASAFLEHFNSVTGTFSTFQLPTSVLTGYRGDVAAFDPENSLRFRYAEPPKIDSVKPGVSSVSVSLQGVLL
jgi:hypothetical protein